jgi:hypothetical protein
VLVLRATANQKEDMQTAGINRLIGATGLAFFAIAAHAQQPPAAGPGGRGPAAKVLVAGENPAIRLLDKENGKAVSSANFWRVEWSPAGAGAVCYLTINGQGAEDLRIAIYDDQKVYDYVTKDLMSSLMNTFNEPPFMALKGTITQTNNGPGERKETCRADRYNIELIWKGLGQGNWTDMKMGTNTAMTFVMVPATSGEILVNGKKAPGTWFPTGGGMGPGAYLTVNETWRR